jgi:hypothetical protein
MGDTESDTQRRAPAVLETPVGQTVMSFVSLSRTTHGGAFVFYTLLLVAVIVMVWWSENGLTPTLSFYGSAVGCTVVIALLLVLMFAQWYMYFMGVLPEDKSAGFAFNIRSGATIQEKTTVKAKSSTSSTAAAAEEEEPDEPPAKPAPSAPTAPTTPTAKGTGNNE